VADTGVNAMGWTFAQAATFLRENTGLEPGAVLSDVLRYHVDPGQAAAYYIGMMAIERLRERCRAKLGPAFDPRRFHEALLGHGALPIDVLERAIGEFVIAEKGRADARRGCDQQFVGNAWDGENCH